MGKNKLKLMERRKFIQMGGLPAVSVSQFKIFAGDQQIIKTVEKQTTGLNYADNK